MSDKIAIANKVKRVGCYSRYISHKIAGQPFGKMGSKTSKAIPKYTRHSIVSRTF
jgi:hypothetical protein